MLVESTMKLNIDSEAVCKVVDKWRQGRVSPDIVCTVMYVVEVLRQPTSILVWCVLAKRYFENGRLMFKPQGSDRRLTRSRIVDGELQFLAELSTAIRSAGLIY